MKQTQRKQGRPRTIVEPTQRIMTRLSIPEYEALQEMAKENRRSTSAQAAACIIEALKKAHKL